MDPIFKIIKSTDPIFFNQMENFSESSDKLTCVTGASGFIGYYIVKALLEKGYRVHGTVRNANDERKNAHLIELAKKAPGQLKLFSADLNVERSFDEAIEKCDYVCHVATTVALKSKNPQKDIVDPAVNGTLNVLRSVIKARKAKRVVITSSRAAVVIGRPKTPDYVYTESDWNTVLDIKNAAYPMGKTLAEKAAWEVYNNQPNDGSWRFELITTLPGMALGPVLCKQHVHTSPQVIKDLMDGTLIMAPDIELDLVDVREVADAHVLALELPSAHGRYILISQNTTFIEAAKILKKKFSKYQIPTRVAPNWLCYIVALFHPTVTWSFLRNQLGVKTELSNSKARNELGLTFRPVEESIFDTAQSLIDLKLI